MADRSEREMKGPDCLPEVDRLRCSGCGRCVAACGARLYTLEDSGNRKHAVRRDAGRCERCLSCLRECPLGAITLY